MRSTQIRPLSCRASWLLLICITVSIRLALTATGDTQTRRVRLQLTGAQRFSSLFTRVIGLVLCLTSDWTVQLCETTRRKRSLRGIPYCTVPLLAQILWSALFFLFIWRLPDHELIRSTGRPLFTQDLQRSGDLRQVATLTTHRTSLTTLRVGSAMNALSALFTTTCIQGERRENTQRKRSSDP